MKHSSPISASRLHVGMDVHKRTIALCMYDSDRGIVIEERELKHDLRGSANTWNAFSGVPGRFTAAMKRPRAAMASIKPWKPRAFGVR